MTCTSPHDTRTAIRTVKYGVGNAECGRGGVCVCYGPTCVPNKVTKQCPAIPEVWGHCPQCPMATLDAEDDVHRHRTTPEPRCAIRTVEY
eukprot:165806-Prymnesium_polylepis.1